MKKIDFSSNKVRLIFGLLILAVVIILIIVVFGKNTSKVKIVPNEVSNIELEDYSNCLTIHHFQNLSSI